MTNMTSNPKDLHSFLEELETKNPDALLRLTDPIETRYEITALQRKLDQAPKYPVILVEKPIGFEGKMSEFPC